MSRARLFAMVWIALAGPGSAAWAEVTWRVGSIGEIERILPGAAVGDVFELAPGDWGPLVLRNVQGIALRPQDPLDRPVFSSLDLSGATDVSLDGLRIEVKDDKVALSLEGAREIDITGLEIFGQQQGTGFAVTGAQGVSITRSSLRNIGTGLRGSDARHLSLSHTEMTGLTGAAVVLRGGSWLTLDSNRFHSFSPDLENPNERRPDMVQLGIGDSAPSHVLVKDNLIDSGAGPARPGLFVGDVFEKRADLVPMQDVTLSGNVVVTAMTHGLFVGPTRGLRVERNAVLRTRQGAHRAIDARDSSPELQVSPLSRDVTIADNWTVKLPTGLGLPGWDVRDNQIAQDIYPGRADHYDALFTAADDADTLAGFQPIPGSAVDIPGSGPGILFAGLSGTPEATALASATTPGVSYVFLQYDAVAGEFVSLDAQGTPRLTERADFGSVPLGAAFPLVQIPRQMVAPIFDTRSFTLRLSLRGREGRRNGGEVLRIHNWMVLDVDNAGSVILNFRSTESTWKRLVLRNTRIGGDRWQDVEIVYDTTNSDGALILRDHNGEVAEVAIHGPTLPLQYWDLTLGNPFGDRETWEGEIGALSLSRKAAQ